MKKLLLVSVFVICSILIFADNQIQNSVINEQLIEKLSTSSESEFVKINISLKERYNFTDLMRNVQFISNDEKREYVITELQNFSQRKQEDLLDQLEVFQTNGYVKEVIPLWITNVINCYATRSVIEDLSLRNDIKSIDWDEKRNMLIDTDQKDQKLSYGNPRDREITWNVTKVNADDVWSLGYSGNGVLVAVLDSGVRYTHDDLEDHVWDGSGAGYPNHGYDFVNSDDDPMDDHSHGTHCAGTIAGDGTSGSQTGMAPDATIMALKVLDSGGSGTESGVWNAIQFCVTHDVDVMSMSIGWQHSWGVDRESWRDAMNNALAAGVIASVAAGNEGNQTGTYPVPDNVRTPGDVPPPWLHPDQTLIEGISAVVCVGAVDSSDDIAYFSSLGPCDWSDVSGYNDYDTGSEMGLLRPDIVAPGMNIKSLDYGSDTGYADGWNGTSMATPCVAGVMALMLEKNPFLTPAQINQTLEETIDIPQSPKNNTYGSGRVDALDAVNATSVSGNPLCNITNPNNGESIEIGTIVTIEVDASDPSRSVSNVKIYIDDVLKTTDYSAPYEYVWNTAGETIDDHDIKATAIDNDLNETDDIITVNIANPTSDIWTDDFETDTGWSFVGEFERDAPTGLGGVSYGNPDPTSAHGGSNVLGVDLTGLGSNSGDYEPSLSDRAYTATSPVIDCNGYTNIQLGFWRWLNVERDTYDNAYLDVYDGATWQIVWENSGTTIEDNSWSAYNYDVSAYADGNSNFRIRFCLGSTDSAWQYSGWNIDDLVLSGEGGPSASITVTAPNGGEDWELDTTHNITWTSSNTSGDVKIELYDNGVFYNTIIASTTDDGTYSWNIPAAYDAGTQYTVKIEDVTDPGTYDDSNADFTLSDPPAITVTSPNGGENWLLDSTHNITWTSVNTSGDVKIELYDNGVFYNTIIASTTDDGTYGWNIPAAYDAGTQYTVKIEDASASSVYDYSDADFTLSEVLPVIDVSVTTLSSTLAPDEIDAAQSFDISNIGDAGSNLTYDITWEYTTARISSDRPPVNPSLDRGVPHPVYAQIYTYSLNEDWLDLDPITGDCDYGETDVIDVEFNSAGLSAGTYTAVISISNNAGADETIDVTLNVTASRDPYPASITFNAWILGREGEVLTESSFGCGYWNTEGWLWVECGNFPTDWTNGDVLHIEAYEPATGHTATGEITLNWEAYQYMDDMHLAPEFPPDTPLNVIISEDGTNVILNWDAVTGATSYTIYSDTDPYGGFTNVEQSGITGTTWSELLTGAGDMKFYQVTASN